MNDLGDRLKCGADTRLGPVNPPQLIGLSDLALQTSDQGRRRTVRAVGKERFGGDRRWRLWLVEFLDGSSIASIPTTCTPDEHA